MDFADTNKDSGVSLNEFCALVKTINEAAASTTSTLTTSYSDNLFFKTSTIFSQDELKTLFNKFSNNSFNMDVKQVRLALKELFNDFEVASDDTLLVIYIIINN